MVRHTHTYAILEVNQSVFREIYTKLDEAGYQDQFHRAGTIIDMHGLALQQEEPQMIKIDLYTADSQFVTTRSITPFHSLPEVIVWGDRAFRRLQPKSDPQEYVECFTYRVVDVPDAPSQSVAVEGHRENESTAHPHDGSCRAGVSHAPLGDSPSPLKCAQALEVLYRHEQGTPEAALAAFVFLLHMPTAEREQLRQLVMEGPVWDGDVVSKSARDNLLRWDLAVRVFVKGEQGFTAATYRGWNVLRAGDE